MRMQIQPYSQGSLPILAFLILMGLLLPTVYADDDITPIRLSYVEGQVSMWRPGADDWGTAQVNYPLGTGDALYTSDRSVAELQFSSGSFIRLAEHTQIRILNHDSGLLQLQINDGHIVVQAQDYYGSRAIEISTPQTAVRLASSGYLRFNVDAQATEIISRRGARAVVTAHDGSVRNLSPEQAFYVRSGYAGIQTGYAPQADSWDQWNDGRSATLVDDTNQSYVPSGIYGASTLNRYGRWQQTSSYGPVWRPDGLSSDWAPYSTGSWIWDRYYGWSWVDSAPWGWAPFHYGRWVHMDFGWGWAPGPRLVTPIYSPALVAFFGLGGAGVGFTSSTVSWLPLGWGEPICPWWGGRSWRGRPQWRGWGGPRVLNNVVVNKTTVINNNTVINNYRNREVPRALVTVQRENFGPRPVQTVAVRNVNTNRLQQLRGALPARPMTGNMIPDMGRVPRPSAGVLARAIVAPDKPGSLAPALHVDTPKPRPNSVMQTRMVKPGAAGRSLDGLPSPGRKYDGLPPMPAAAGVRGGIVGPAPGSREPPPVPGRDFDNGLRVPRDARMEGIDQSRNVDAIPRPVPERRWQTAPMERSNNAAVQRDQAFEQREAAIPRPQNIDRDSPMFQNELPQREAPAMPVIRNVQPPPRMQAPPQIPNPPPRNVDLTPRMMQMPAPMQARPMPQVPMQAAPMPRMPAAPAMRTAPQSVQGLPRPPQKPGRN